MTEIRADSPVELLLDLKVARPRAYRFEHSWLTEPLALDEPEIRALCVIYQDTENDRDIGRDLAVLETYKKGTYGRERADIMRLRLIPSGLIEPDPSAGIPSIFMPSEMARTGTYVEVI